MCVSEDQACGPSDIIARMYGCDFTYCAIITKVYENG